MTASQTVVELPVIAAVVQASAEHDAWLASIGTHSVIGVNEHPHVWLGWGAPAGEVAQVLWHGKTFHAAWTQATLKRGLLSLAELRPWETYARVREEMWAECEAYLETRSELSRAVAQLLRAERLGLVERRLTHPKGGLTYWTVAA